MKAKGHYNIVVLRGFFMFKRLLAVLTAGVAAVVFIGCGGEEPTSPKNAPQITQQPVSVSAYVGQSVSLYVIATAKPAPTFQWRKDGVDIVGATQWEYVISSVTAADSGIYTVVVSNSEGSVTSSGGTLTVWTPPEITLQPVSQTVGEGGSVTFTVSAMGNPLPTYQWQYNYADISGETSSTLQISGVTPGDAGLYDVVVSNGAGTVLSTVATLTVQRVATITVDPASQLVDEGGWVIFNVVVTGDAPISYQWYKDGGALAGETNSSLIINPVMAADAGDYTVIVTNVAGSDTSSSATLTVNVAPAVTTDPSSQTIDEGSSVTFTVAATGTSPLGYQWRKDGVDISGATSDSYTIAAVALADAGDYTVVVSNVVGSVTSSSATLTVTQMYPVLLTPADGATNVSVTPTFTWEAFPGAASYEIEVGTTPDVSTGWVVYDGNVTSTTYTPGGPLANATVYYWHVLAHDGGGGGLGTWSLISSFTTEP